MTSLVAQTVRRLPTMQESRVQSLGQEDALEKGMATHSSILAWRSPRTEERIVKGARNGSGVEIIAEGAGDRCAPSD